MDTTYFCEHRVTEWELAVIARVPTIYDSSPQTIIPLLFTRTFQFLTLGVRVWLQVLQQ